MAFSTDTGKVIERELLLLCLKAGDGNTYTAIGSHVTDSSEEYDWSMESAQDILGVTRVTMKKPIITQTFDPLPLVGGDAALEYIHKLAVEDQDYATLAALDVVIVHTYDSNFAERYDASAIQINGLGGSGGGNITMPISVTLGGNRTTGTATVGSNGTVTFTPKG